eukprot:2013531-Amphidinium_carterae.2
MLPREVKEQLAVDNDGMPEVPLVNALPWRLCFASPVRVPKHITELEGVRSHGVGAVCTLMLCGNLFRIVSAMPQVVCSTTSHCC